MPVRAPLSTFLKWPVGDNFDYDVEVEEGKTFVIEMRCKICAKHVDKIKRDDRVKGTIAKEVDVFVEGSQNVKKHAVTRHLEGKVHAIAHVSKLLT